MKTRKNGFSERMNTMSEYKLNSRYIAFNCIFLAVIYPIIKVMFMLAGNKITMEDEPMPLVFRILVGIIVYFFGTLYIYTAIAMLLHLIIRKRQAFSITEKGIENSSTLGILFAFVFFGRIKCIPWEAIKGYKIIDGKYYLKIDTSKIDASPFAKMSLKIKGFDFCNGFTKRFSEDDFKKYIEYHIN